jgi:hypothetical protein
MAVSVLHRPEAIEFQKHDGRLLWYSRSFILCCRSTCVAAESVSRLKPDPSSNSLALIGAGFGRTGTTSLKKALEILGLGPCYHMRAAMSRPSHARFWIRASTDPAVDFRHFFRGYRASVDWPACEFYRELMAAFPDAKVLLNVRDPERSMPTSARFAARCHRSVFSSIGSIRAGVHCATFWAYPSPTEFRSPASTIEGTSGVYCWPSVSPIGRCQPLCLRLWQHRSRICASRSVADSP